MNHHLQPWRVIQQISELANLPCGDNNLCILEHLAALRRCMELRVGVYLQFRQLTKTCLLYTSDAADE